MRVCQLEEIWGSRKELLFLCRVFTLVISVEISFSIYEYPLRIIETLFCYDLHHPTATRYQTIRNFFPVFSMRIPRTKGNETIIINAQAPERREKRDWEMSNGRAVSSLSSRSKIKLVCGSSNRRLLINVWRSITQMCAALIYTAHRRVRSFRIYTRNSIFNRPF